MMRIIDVFGKMSNMIIGIHTHGDRGDSNLNCMGLLFTEPIFKQI